MNISFKKVKPGATLPVGEDNDICSLIDHTILPNDYAVIPTGLVPVIPRGFKLQIQMRRSLAENCQVFALPGVVHSKSKEEIVIILVNLSVQAYKVKEGDPIAQMELSPVISFNPLWHQGNGGDLEAVGSVPIADKEGRVEN